MYYPHTPRVRGFHDNNTPPQPSVHPPRVSELALKGIEACAYWKRAEGEPRDRDRPLALEEEKLEA